MRRKLALGMIYATLSCAHPASPAKDDTLAREVKTMDFRLLNLEYEHNVQNCFNQYDFCVLKRGEDCWKKHEKCVIETTKWYKKILKIRGHE